MPHPLQAVSASLSSIRHTIISREIALFLKRNSTNLRSHSTPTHAAMATTGVERVKEHIFVKLNQPLEVKKLLKQRPEAIYNRDDYDQTMLHVACFEGYNEIAEIILNKYKVQDLKLRDKNGWTALHCACIQGNYDICEALLKKGASPNAQNGDLASPFYYLCRNAYSERLMLLLDLMLKKGADVHLQNKWLETPLHQACSRGCVETTLFLLRQGADPNALNYYNETPLHKACRLPPSQALKMVTVLIEHGSDPLIAGYCGNAISVAMQSGNQSSAEYLKQVLETKIVMIGTRGENMVEKIPGTRLVSSKSLDDQYRVHSAHMNVGPSIDNIDLETILFIRSENEQSRTRTKLVQASSTASVLSPRSEVSEESTSATNSLALNNTNRVSDASDESKDSSEQQARPANYVPKPPIPGLPLVVSTDEFRVEMGVEFIVTDDVLGMSKADLRIEDDNYSFDYGQGGAEDVVNIIGKLHSTFLEEPIAISILKTPDKQKHRGLFRTKAGDFKFFIPAALIKQGKSTSKQVLKALRTSVPQLMDAKLHVITDPKLQEELAYLEELKKKQAKFFKIGVLFARAGQTTEEEIFGNEHGSEAFEEFLKLLGERIELQGWKGFRGDLDVQGKSGEFSVYTKLREYEIMFHVSTYLPYNAQDPQQIMRKKYIGNDLSTIVFVDGEHGSFTPPTVSGDFLHIFAVVNPTETGYKLGVASKVGVPAFGPPLPKPPEFPKNTYFRDFLLTKILNGEQAAFHSPFIAAKMRKTRRAHLQRLVEQFCTNDTKL